MVYWLAALQTVPADQLDAARIDGAGGWHLVRYITLPHLRPFAIVIVLITAVSALRVLDLVQTMTGGGPSPLTASDSARRSGVPENRMFWFTAADAVGAN